MAASSSSEVAGAGHLGREELMQELSKLEIDVVAVEHPEVFTVEAMMPYLEDIQGAVTKNLFLKDKKKKGLWLATLLWNRDLNLANLAKQVGAGGGFRLADESLLFEKLGVKQGGVTPFALINDRKEEVKFILDSAVLKGGHQHVFGHPLVNTATIGVTPPHFEKFCEYTKHTPILVDFE